MLYKLRKRKDLTILLRNCVEYRLILSRRGRSPSWLKQWIFRKIEQDNCFIIQHMDNKAQLYCRKADIPDFYFAICLPDTRNYVARRILSVPWPYLGGVTMCRMITCNERLYCNSVVYSTTRLRERFRPLQCIKCSFNNQSNSFQDTKIWFYWQSW